MLLFVYGYMLQSLKQTQCILVVDVWWGWAYEIVMDCCCDRSTTSQIEKKNDCCCDVFI